MPYPRAHFYVLVVIAVIVAGFWESYLSVWGKVPWQFHAHGVAASIWVSMVAAQSWTAHHRQLPLHRAIGKSSLLLFPFLIAGLAAIIDVTGKAYVAGVPSRVALGGVFLIGLVIAAAAYVTVFYRALRYRRKVWVHSGYMLSTPLILFESPFSRVLGTWVPGLTVRGPQDMGLVIVTIVLAMAAELAVIAVLWMRYREKAKPFVVAGGFIVAQMVTMSLMQGSAVLNALLEIVGRAPSATVVLTGFAVGALTSWAGWQAGKRGAVPVGRIAQTA